MKLSTREDIEAPIDSVFEQLTDFDGFERAVLRRGAEVARTDENTVPGVGMAWRIGFDYRGRERSAEITMTEFDPPNGMKFMASTSGLENELVVELMALSRARTRMSVIVDAKPTTIPARLLIQSLKLARGNVEKRYKRRVSEFAKEVEARCLARLG